MGQVKVRFAEPMKAEIDAISGIEQESMPSPWSWNAIAEELASQSPSAAKFLVAEEEVEVKSFFGSHSETRIVGHVSAWFIPPYEVQIGNVAVSPAFRKKGIGSLLMEALIEEAKNQGIEDISLEVRPSNMPALKLYEKYGFKEEGRRKNYYENKEDAIIMWRHGQQ